MACPFRAETWWIIVREGACWYKADIISQSAKYPTIVEIPLIDQWQVNLGHVRKLFSKGNHLFSYSTSL